MTRVRPLTEADLDAWIALRAAGFGARPGTDVTELRTRLAGRLAHARGVESDGRLVACCTWLPFPAWIGGVHVPTGALGGVASAPEARRRGHVRDLVVAGLDELHRRGVGWALEHPFDPRFYAPMGFRTVPAGVYLDLPIERLPGRARDVAFEPTTPDDPELRRVRAAFAAGHGFALDRDVRFASPDPDPDPDGLPERWRDLFEPFSDAVGPATPYRTEGGYVIVTTEGFGADGVLHVVDAAWDGPAARARVLAALTAWRGQVARVRLDLPANDPLALDDAAVHGRPRAVLQARISDLPAALAPLGSVRAAALGRAVIAVRDPLCPWNDGTWELRFGSDGTAAARSDAASGATVSVGALAAVLGGVPPAALAAVGEVEGDLAPLHALASTTEGQPPFLGRADHF